MKKRLFAKKTLAMTMAALMAAGMLAGCSSGSKETGIIIMIASVM